MKTLTKIIFCVWAMILILLATLQILKNFNIYFIYEKIPLVLTTIFLLLSGILLYKYIRKQIKTKKHVLFLKISAVAVTILGLYIGIHIGMLAIVFSHEPYKTLESPNKVNTVIVFEGGFIDAVYSAYPLLNGLFYKDTGSEILSHHDLWGGAEIEAEWEGDSAVKVYVIFDKVAGRNEEDVIRVQFD
jgi:hypothetical protein